MENDQNSQLSHKEQYQLRQKEKIQEQNRLLRKRALKRGIKTAVIAVIIGGSVGWFIWYIATLPQTPSSETISKSGIHWHPRLAIFIKDKAQEIPANLGIGAVHNPMHTHDSTGVIHLEFQGVVRKNDLYLGRFFKIWGKQFNENCIFEYCNGPDGKIKMTVNGTENNEFQNYPMRDSDQIEIRYE